MRDQDKFEQERRRILKLLGTSAALLPLAGLGACSGDKTPEPAAEAPPAPEPASAPEPAPAAQAEAPAADVAAPQGELPALAEDDPQAKALSYVEDATTVDGSKFPQYKEGQLCANCALYQGGDAPQGPCSIFPGRSVKAAGWCSVYAPRA